MIVTTGLRRSTWTRDGRVTEREWHGSQDTFQWLDRNQDGC